MKSPSKKKLTPKTRKPQAVKSFLPPGPAWSLSKRKRQAKAVVAALRLQYPNAHCELSYHTPYQLLVSVVLSAQATDKTVNRVMEPLYAKGFTPEMVVRWGQEKLLSKIREIGLAPTKSRNVYRLSQILLDQFQGDIPRSREDLESLPGVGRKTANVILGEIFREPTLAVDTHVYRVGMRLGLHTAKTPEKAELELLEVVDPQDLPEAHHLFIFHGRYTCKSIKPACEICPLTKICPSYALFKNKAGVIAKKPLINRQIKQV
ncbi:MAG: endonuclease III [Oligoflexus sp.]